MAATTFSRELEVAIQAARQAGEVLLRHRKPGVAFEEKAGGEGPVTAADKEADQLVRKVLTEAFPGDGLLTEETPDDGAWRKRSRVWMVDPMDGTKEYVRGGDEFASMVGLCVDGQPVVGAVYQPTRDLLLAASPQSGTFQETGGKREPLVCPTGIPSPLTVAVSRSHRTKRLDDILARIGPVQELTHGSVGLKLGLVAQGKAQSYLNAGSRCALWDTCAPAAILLHAGGLVTDLFGRPISHAAGLHHVHGLFCASADVHARLKDKVALAAREVAELLRSLPEYPRDAFRLPDGY